MSRQSSVSLMSSRRTKSASGKQDLVVGEVRAPPLPCFPCPCMCLPGPEGQHPSLGVSAPSWHIPAGESCSFVPKCAYRVTEENHRAWVRAKPRNLSIPLIHLLKALLILPSPESLLSVSPNLIKKPLELAPIAFFSIL